MGQFTIDPADDGAGFHVRSVGHAGTGQGLCLSFDAATGKVAATCAGPAAGDWHLDVIGPAPPTPTTGSQWEEDPNPAAATCARYGARTRRPALA